ncbi:tRNA (cytosine(34)-C(5))-methyltransferase-like [Coffea eugenioides]|uniref:tRNA (cytosine(34)-C(5))-methyltransferase-like n=1 Tax=Coffea eugenioides TaxID=49369 RepID=UPI000F60F5E0|nr:tRNA (cytosine(34)-C(5))-methyltransferase-like [Coffea eugenioides]
MGGGRNRSSRTQRRHFKQGRENVWKRNKSDSEQQEDNQDNKNNNPDENSNNPTNPPWEPLTTQNPSFDEYYKEQGVVAAEEWDAFMECLRTALPAAFRINSSSPFYNDIRSQLENDFMKSLLAEGTDGSEMEAIRPLPWYPDNLAWHSNFSRKQLRKNQTLERFHSFLKLENEIGNITRQEAVSMVPPLFLDVCPHHFVLDMCAAPGSKTFQLLEMIHQLTSPGSLPNGLVVANDVDIQRCNLLIHQTKRMSTANLIVTTHEAQHFPSCHHNRSCQNASECGIVKKPDISQLLFDRVLCDVPCSGDGTLRKAPDIWRKWNPGMGNGLHGLQILIAMRGLSLLKVGGRMVYSTCSMNPIENEAVVAEILRRCKGSVELVDVSSELPQLVRRPGLKKWKVRDKGLWLNSYRDVPENRKAAVVPSMFPTGRTFEDISDNDCAISTEELCTKISNGNSEDGIELEDDSVANTNLSDVEESTLPLEHCMRIAPHDENTGAFFIAVLHKISALPAVQKKSLRSTGKLSSSKNVQAQNATCEVKEDTDFIEITDGPVSEADAQVPETVSVSSHTDEMAEAVLDADPSIPSEENEAGDIQPSKGNKSGPEVVGGKRKLQVQGKWIGVDPVIFYRDDSIVSKIKEFYGIKESFPFNGHLVTRNSDTSHVKRIYYVSNSVKEVLELNLLAGQQLKIASVGVKMFERQTSKEGTASACSFRISSEGLPLLLPHVTKQILYASTVDFKHLLQYKSIKFADFTDAEFRSQASNLSLGCCILVLIKDNQKAPDTYQVDASSTAIGCWRGRNSISVMVTAIDCQELLERMPMHLETDLASSEENKPSSVQAAEAVVEMKDAEIKEEN